MLPQDSTERDPSIWLTTIIPLIVGGLTIPFIPNAAIWVFSNILPGNAAADFWEQIGIYVALLRFTGIVLFVAGVYVAVREVRRVKRAGSNSDSPDASN